ncbi:MAG: hypothetical protein IMZ52_04725 [Actinobacteria bacterium]|nr:hypothetical protein [Actinomycetota bacterium]MBE3114769.1 hypothetical protein [Actinomycetota bacterium]
MPDKVKVNCHACNKEYFIEFNEVHELFGRKCEKCGSDEIFYQEIIYEVEPDRTPVKTGERGCGTSGRFK